jgi:CRISPR/Cas system-associated exonuclease Cas4 (RecB family)
VSDLASTELNLAQREVLEQLGATREQRPVFSESLAHDLRSDLEAGLEPFLASLGPNEELRLAKRELSTVLGCQRRYLAERDAPFVVNVAIARGTVSHKAIEIGINRQGDKTPSLLVDDALARLENDDQWVSEFLQTCTHAERAELRSAAVEHVSKFEECWPELKPTWHPVTESTMIAELVRDRVVLRGKVDLTVGRPDGMRAGKVLIDFKSGRSMPSHLDDLRFYALVETLRIGTPPRRLATYYLDQGRFLPEDVTVELLETTVVRVIASAERIVALADFDGDPTESPGPACRWCTEREICPSGQRFIEDDPDLN